MNWLVSGWRTRRGINTVILGLAGIILACCGPALGSDEELEKLDGDEDD